MMTIKLRDYQEKAVETFLKQPTHKGIIVMPTGAGKTLVAIEIAKRLFDKNEINDLLVITPTVALALQWQNELKKHKLPNRLTLGSDAVTVANITTHTSFVKGIQRGYKRTQFSLPSYSKGSTSVVTLLVVDEVHHAHKGTKLYDAIIKFNAAYGLGLTATINKEEIYPFPVIYEITGTDLIRYLPKPVFHKVIVDPCKKEDYERYCVTETCKGELIDNMYEYTCDNFTTAYEKLTLRLKNLARDLDKLETAIQRSTNPDSYLNRYKKMLQTWKSTINMRIGLVSSQMLTINAACKIALEKLAENPKSKIIIFTQRKAVMSQIGKIIHDETKKQGIKIYMATEKIRSSKELKEANVIIAAKRLSEGIDLPEVDTVIMQSYPLQIRYSVQSVGRALRGPPDKKVDVYYIVIPRTYEEIVYQKILNFYNEPSSRRGSQS